MTDLKVLGLEKGIILGAIHPVSNRKNLGKVRIEFVSYDQKHLNPIRSDHGKDNTFTRSSLPPGLDISNDRSVQGLWCTGPSPAQGM